jgi:hypothetical protein
MTNRTARARDLNRTTQRPHRRDPDCGGRGAGRLPPLTLPPAAGRPLNLAGALRWNLITLSWQLRRPPVAIVLAADLAVAAAAVILGVLPWQTVAMLCAATCAVMLLALPVRWLLHPGADTFEAADGTAMLSICRTRYRGRPVYRFRDHLALPGTHMAGKTLRDGISAPLLGQLTGVPRAAIYIKAQNERVRDRYTAEIRRLLPESWTLTVHGLHLLAAPHPT